MTIKEGPPPDAIRRALTDPTTLPTDLAVRSYILILLTVASTAAIYSHLWLLTLAAGEQSGANCLSPGVPAMGGFTPGEIDQFIGPAAHGLACIRPYTSGLLLAGTAGVTLVVLTMLAVYLLQPAWIWRLHTPARRYPMN